MVIGTALGWSDLATIVLAVALASDTISIAIMEIVDNAIMLLIPGGDGGDPERHRVLGGAVAAFPANRWLLARGKGHAVVHQHHAH